MTHRLKMIATIMTALLGVMVFTCRAHAGEVAGPAHGSGVFGQWIIDEYGLPAYLYTMRHNDPRALWNPRTEPITNLMWHQLGSDRVNADAYNLGFVKLFYGESGAMWLNEYEPAAGAHSGGFGWLIDGGTVMVDRDDLVRPGAEWQRVFGMGYYKKRLCEADLCFERRVYAGGDAPGLVSEVTIINRSDRPRRIFLIEYWDVNMRLLTDFLMGRGMAARHDDHRVSLRTGGPVAMLKACPKRLYGPYGGFPDKPAQVDPELPALFLASPDLEPEAWITDPEELFNGAVLITDPAVLLLAGSKTPDPNPRAQKRACLAARLRFDLAPHSEKVLRFVYGYEKGTPADRTLSALVSAGREPEAMAEKWAASLPTLSLPGDPVLSRELEWDYYYLTSSELFDAYYQKHHVPQGANYLYYSGMNGATRDYAAFVQALAYYRPGLAREVLEFMMRCQDTDGRLFYDIGGFGKRYNNPYRPGDLDIWFLWALSEYVFATRDFAFLDQIVPFHPLDADQQATVWEHARRSLDHLINIVGTGPHGHPKLRLSDWNDEMTFLSAGSNPVDIVATYVRGESVMNTAMNCYVMPMVRDLAVRHGDRETAESAGTYLDKMRKALASAWHNDHLVRAYSGLGKPFGADQIYLEPQVWALLAGDVLTPDQESTLVAVINSKLREPSSIGMMISTSTSGSATTRPGEQEEGGVWFAINGPAVLALSRFDRGMAWDELTRNTLARHAEVYPQTWYGIWSGPDAWNSVFSDRPAETWYMKTPVINTGPQMYPVQNAHAHCQTMWATARLAGVDPTPGGWTIEPKIPCSAYSFSCALYSIEVSPQKVSGAVTLPVDADMVLTMILPGIWSPGEVFMKLEYLPVRRENGRTIFEIPVSAKAGVPSKFEFWKIPWDGRSGN